MPVYRKDRDRRILGGRALSRQAEFYAIHPAVKEVHQLFASAHASLLEAIQLRQQEEGEDAVARKERDDAAEEGLSLYTWAYETLDHLLPHSWEHREEDSLSLERERIFKLGSPYVISKSTQLIFDAMGLFLEAMANQPVDYPPAFLSAFQAAHEDLEGHINTVTREHDETLMSSKAVQDARRAWDNTYVALREVTDAFLRLSHRAEDMGHLFQSLTRKHAKNTEESNQESD